MHDERGKTIYANDAAVRLLGAASDRRAARGAARRDRGALPDDARGRVAVGVDELPGRRAVLGELAEPTLTRSVNLETGDEYWLLTKATVVHDEAGRPLAVNIIQDVTVAKETERRQRFLAEAGRLLASSLDCERTLAQVARLAVPALGDWCAIDLVGDEGELDRVAVAHADPAKVALVGGCAPSFPPATRRQRRRARGAHRARGAAPADHREMLRAAAVDDAQLELGRDARRCARRSSRRCARASGPRRHLARDVRQPARAATRATSRSSRTSRCARARRSRTRACSASGRAPRRRCRTACCRAACPSSPAFAPRPPTARAAPAARSAATSTTSSRSATASMVLLGDVTGKGVDAAALTALVRHTAKTAARFDSRPSAVLRRRRRDPARAGRRRS